MRHRGASRLSGTRFGQGHHRKIVGGIDKTASLFEPSMLQAQGHSLLSTTPQRVRREIPDLVEALRRHVRLLKDFASKAFQESDLSYLGEVAAKLRLLVYEQGRNKPLLLALMDEFGLDIRIKLGGPPVRPPPGQPGPGDEVSLREYLGLTAYGIRTPSRGYVELTKKQLIGIWAAQHGAAHEDWELQEEFALARDSVIYIGGIPELAAELRVTTQTVLHFAETFLGALTPELIAQKTGQRS